MRAAGVGEIDGASDSVGCWRRGKRQLFREQPAQKTGEGASQDHGDRYTGLTAALTLTVNVGSAIVTPPLE